MGHLQIHTFINSRYNVFDQSGKLPFGIVFGLCRRSKEDTDPRPLQLSTSRTILDVPYALSHGLLEISVEGPENASESSVDLEQLGQNETDESSYFAIPSPVGRTKHWRQSLSVYQYHIDPSSDLAKLFKPGKRYSIRIRKGGDMGGTGHTFTDHKESIKHPENSFTSEEPQKLEISRADGRASFNVVQSLPWPPTVQVQMRRHQSDEEKSNAILEVVVVNTGKNTVSIQTRGRQRYLVPWGPMDTEIPSEDPRSRIIDSKLSHPGASIQIIDIATKTVVRAASKPPICGLYKPHDPRPLREMLVTLKPGEPLVRYVDVSKLLLRLPDATYGLWLEPRGLWWCHGDRDEFAPSEDDRVPRDLYRTKIPALMLECEDIVELRVENGVAK